MSKLPNDERPPLFKSWSYWYFSVLAFLVILIILFSLFTKRFA